MEAYLHALTAEFVENYKDISRAQSVYEAQMKNALGGNSKVEGTLPDNFPWTELQRFPCLSDFLSRNESLTPKDYMTLPIEELEKSEEANKTSYYSAKFLAALDLASDKLRTALELELA